jgi:hypothetical protein
MSEVNRQLEPGELRAILNDDSPLTPFAGMKGGVSRTATPAESIIQDVLGGLCHLCGSGDVRHLVIEVNWADSKILSWGACDSCLRRPHVACQGEHVWSVSDG